MNPVRRRDRGHAVGRDPVGVSVLGLLLGLALACSKGAPPAHAPEIAPAPPESSASEAATTAPSPLTLPAPTDGEPEPLASCPKAAALPVERHACPAHLADLARALGAQPEAADTALAELEVCSEFRPGIVRALRAGRWLACADQLVDGAVGPHAPEAELDVGTRELLVATGLAGRLSRLVQTPPEARAHASKAELEHYLSEHLFPWATRQAKAIGEMSRRGASLRGYARGIVAIQAALADLRFVEMARGLPLPVEMEAPDIQAEYYGALDQALEPRKDRARDAALVALGEFSALGILKSAALSDARQLISRVFAGNRIVALDALLVPPPAECTATTPEEAIAAAVESPFATELLGTTPLTPALSTCLLTRGLSVDLLRQLEGDASPGGRSSLARAQFDLGRTYMKASAFQRAADLYRQNAAGAQGVAAPGDELLGALATVLSAAPESAVDLFRLGPRLPSGLGETGPLDGLAGSTRRYAGAAAFDAAYLRELTAPDGSASHFSDVARRYDTAQRKLTGQERALAADRARAARATAKALERQLN